ncbi:hypothetical protein WA171_001649 [Blastocystis sp. BT1]
MHSDPEFEDPLSFEETRVSSDIVMLKTAYRNELIAPEILDYKMSLISRMKERVDTYESVLEEEPRSSVDDSFRIMLYEMDVERIKYLLTSYLRTRLHKIELYHKFILRNNQTARLSADETAFLEKFAKLNQNYFESTIQSHFHQPPYVTPGEDMDETTSVIVNYTQYCEDEMDCPFPNTKKLVGVRLLAGNDPVEIPVEDKSTGETVDVRIGTDHVTVIEFEIIEPFILGSDTFELSSD